MRLPSAKEARDIADRAAEEAKERMKRERDDAYRRDQERVEEIAAHLSRTIPPEIVEAMESGQRRIEHYLAKSDTPYEAITRLGRTLSALGYKWSVDENETDYGDSAAPCRVEQWVLRVSW